MGAVPAIEFRNVSYRLPDGRALLNDVTLEVAMGTTVALLGKSGSGKTTLLRTVNRMHGVSSGEVLVRGRSIFEQEVDPAAPFDRLCDPGDRALPALYGGAQHRAGAGDRRQISRGDYRTCARVA